MVSGTAQARPQGHGRIGARRCAREVFIWIFAALLCAAGLNAPPASAAENEACRAPSDLVRFHAGLPRLSGALKRGEPVRIAALGSSSTEGAGASSKTACYPARLQAELRRRFPGAEVEVVNLGIGGELARDMVERIETQVTGLDPHLVIWQTGVNDALRGVAMDEFRSEVMRGLKILRGHGYDVALLDQQFYPKSKDLPAYREYIAALREISRANEVPLLRRYAIMKHLVESGQYAIGDLLAPDRFHQNDEGYRCLGTLMTDAIEAAVRPSNTVPGFQRASVTALPGAGSR